MEEFFLPDDVNSLDHLPDKYFLYIVKLEVKLHMLLIRLDESAVIARAGEPSVLVEVGPTFY